MKKLCFGFAALGLVAVTSLGACSSDSSGGHDTSAVDAFIQSLAAAQCDWEFRCCKDAEIKASAGAKYKTKDECLPYAQLAEASTLYLDRLAVREGRLRVDPTHAAACLQQATTKACNPAPGKPSPPINKATDCAHVFVGNTAVGNECIYSNECVDGAHCVSDAAAVGRGVCVPFQKVGDICNSDKDCDPTVEQIYCAEQDFKCHVRGKVGEPCAYTTTAGSEPRLPLLLECDTTVPGTFCDPSAKLCATLPGDGKPCLATLPPGVTSRCNPDPALELVCDTAGGASTCRAPGQLGADCSTRECAADLYCARSGMTSVCTALPGLGQPCPTGRCAKPNYCNADKFPEVCDAPARLGEDCRQVSCDTGLYCDTTGASRTCQAQLPNGAVCTSSLQCQSRVCNGTCEPGGALAVCTGR